MVCNKDEIKKFQVIQEDYRMIRILVVPQKDLTGSFRRAVEREIDKIMGDCDISWDITGEIPKIKKREVFIYEVAVVADLKAT